MNVTREVIKDLLPLYQEGEVSPDTRRLVEEYLATDAELRDQIAAPTFGQQRLPVRAEIDPALAALERTKRALRRQKWLQFFALLLTLAPFTSYGTGGQLKFMVLRDAPLSLIPLWGGAAIFWAFYLKSRRSGVSA
ncbi:MAG: zf-HC2 domain-containing protein [Bryobacteraceae bacterium]|nr:zf-HC2 domain-containing protein [Bryobacteraceae bacterium]